MHWFLRLLRFISGENRFPTIDEIHKAFFCEEVKLIETPVGGWEGRFDYVRFVNSQISIFYHSCSGTDGIHEDIDAKVIGKRGGIWATYFDNRLRSVTLNAVSLNPSKLAVESKEALYEVVLRLRKICAEKNISTFTDISG